MTKNFNFENLELTALNSNEMTSIDGGYSWEEFKQDVKDFFKGVNDGLAR